MAVEPDSAGVRFPPPFVYLGALLLGLTEARIWSADLTYLYGAGL